MIRITSAYPDCEKEFGSRRFFLVVAVLACAAPLVFGQASTAQGQTPAAASPAGNRTSSPPAFEVASIKANKDISSNYTYVRGHRLDFVDTPLIYAIEKAYNVKGYQISGPGWIKDARYDIHAIEPAGPHERQAWRPMLQTLLAERFQLKLHRETKRVQAYALVVMKKGPKLQKVDTPGDYDISGQGSHYAFARVSMPIFAERLSNLTGRPVADQTGLFGNYNFSLRFSREGEPDAAGRAPAPADPADPDIFTAIEEQLGLKLVSQKGPVEVLVIDHVERPSSN